ncbi:hypothetical protein [Pedobacter mucosus]|uniref:hypothetical protein n=1 Tax=Pedobacter mucosus TaxID=2895286 RepID=UPI001EE4D645|nr:hypothetical protein [Pedobacter mucosus]UKT66023.1 hypothetical protein LOK61_09570 [Pedobacter mucosus]
MLVNNESSQLSLDAIKVGDFLYDGNGISGTVVKIDVSKFRSFIQYYFRLSGSTKKISILLNQK